MKQFLLNVLAGVVALCLYGFLSFIMFMVFIASLAASGGSTAVVENGAVMRISLDKMLDERTEENPFATIMNNGEESSVGLDLLLEAINEARDNDKIAGIYLDGGALMSDFASLEELRSALLDFKQSDKFIVSYAEQFTQSGYYIASVADTIFFNPSGMLDWHGISSQPMFYTDLMKKLGVKMQVFKVGTYKSAVEPFILTEMSEANRLQVSSFVNDIWSNIVADVSGARPVLMADSLYSYAAQYMALMGADAYLDKALVDVLAYQDGVRDWLRNHVKDGKVKFVKPADVASLHKETSATDNHVAVYYAYGDIVDEVSTGSLMGGNTEIVGSVVVEDLDKLANDDNVKAVVLRINSGGGSAYASEQMWRAIQLLKEKKPVVVSMGGMAASGGYYMSCGADYIFADATTLTGSIGIFGMIPDASELLNDKLGLHFDVVKTNEGADFGAMGRPFNASESAAMQAYVESGYDLFTRRVAEGRGMTQAEVDSIGQGRVWTGAQAIELGLVDEIGTLSAAVAKAEILAGEGAGIKGVVAYPAPSSLFESFVNDLVGEDYMERKARAALGIYYEPVRVLATIQRQSPVQARIPFNPNMK